MILRSWDLFPLHRGDESYREFIGTDIPIPQRSIKANKDAVEVTMPDEILIVKRSSTTSF